MSKNLISPIDTIKKLEIKYNNNKMAIDNMTL